MKLKKLRELINSIPTSLDEEEILISGGFDNFNATPVEDIDIVDLQGEEEYFHCIDNEFIPDILEISEENNLSLLFALNQFKLKVESSESFDEDLMEEIITDFENPKLILR